MKIVDVNAENVELNKTHIHLVIEGLQDALKFAQTAHDLIGEDIDIEVKKHRQKRSLNANAYLRVLEGKIADALDADKNEIHNDMLCRYGQYQTDETGNVMYCLYKQDIDYRGYETLHLKPTGHSEKKGNVLYQWYAVIKPSHEYDSQEMAKLIDGVVSEAKELDIETLTPDEIKRMENCNG